MRIRFRPIPDDVGCVSTPGSGCGDMLVRGRRVIVMVICPQLVGVDQHPNPLSRKGEPGRENSLVGGHVTIPTRRSVYCLKQQHPNGTAWATLIMGTALATLRSAPEQGCRSPPPSLFFHRFKDRFRRPRGLIRKYSGIAHRTGNSRRVLSHHCVGHGASLRNGLGCRPIPNHQDESQRV